MIGIRVHDFRRFSHDKRRQIGDGKEPRIEIILYDVPAFRTLFISRADFLQDDFGLVHALFNFQKRLHVESNAVDRKHPDHHQRKNPAEYRFIKILLFGSPFEQNRFFLVDALPDIVVLHDDRVRKAKNHNDTEPHD